MNLKIFKDKYLNFNDYIDFKYFLVQMILLAIFAVIITELILGIVFSNLSFSNISSLRLVSIIFYIFLLIYIKKDYKRISLLTNILFVFLIIESVFFSITSFGDYLIIWLIASQLVFGAVSVNEFLFRTLTAYYFALYLGLSIITNSIDANLHKLIYLTFVIVINYYVYLGIEKYFSQNEVINDMEEALEDLKNNSSHSLKDALTNTYNRKSLYSILKREIALVKQNKTTASLVFIDLDNFKAINDEFGHQKGDFILKKLSTIFLNIIRDDDYICRFGGDEFIFILSNCDKETAVDIISRIKNKMNIHLNNKDIYLDFSYGIKEIEPGINLTSKEIIDCADNAMYENKNKKRKKNNFNMI